MRRVTDDDCREVARRLRSLDDSELQVYDMTYFAIQRAVGGGGDQHPDGRELADRLADLIELSCDRDALLTLAEEMDRNGKVQRERQKAGEHWFIDGLDVREYARRIREALGVTS